jgi:hypothetical protein
MYVVYVYHQLLHTEPVAYKAMCVIMQSNISQWS